MITIEEWGKETSRLIKRRFVDPVMSKVRREYPNFNEMPPWQQLEIVSDCLEGDRWFRESRAMELHEAAYAVE